ncbi:MAG: hypothetical protein ABJB05_02465 [Parafilimonas sp.]
MKKTIYALTGMMFLMCLGFSAKAQNLKNSSNTVCFNDGFYNWIITYTDNGSGAYNCTGTVSVDGTNWNVSGWGNFAGHMGSVEFHAANPNPDGCFQYTDSFTYAGNAQITGNGSGTRFSGNGNWSSYCGGGVYSTGTWGAQGPCGTLKSVPYGPAKHSSSQTAKNASNTVCFNDGFYNWFITYTDNGSGAYNCTGTVSVDGTNWNVWGWGNFANHMGSVEFHASNPNPDGCFQYTDSFTYAGNAQITGNGSGTMFGGNGNWTSYCAGGVYSTGTWAAQGPCGGALKSMPYGPAKHSSSQTAKNASNTVCFNDGFSNFRIAYTEAGNGSYTCTGTYTVDGTPWAVTGWGNFMNHMGSVELHVSNPNPDGCVSYSDSFTYVGTAEIMGNGSSTVFTGGGNWTSYCYGGVLFTGTWSAQGPCSGTLKSSQYGPAKHAQAAFKINISPNPLKSTSTVSYETLKQSQVNITVYNYMQQPVRIIVNGNVSAGKHSAVIDGSSLANGMYRVVAIVDGKSYTSSLQVVR